MGGECRFSLSTPLLPGERPVAGWQLGEKEEVPALLPSSPSPASERGLHSEEPPPDLVLLHSNLQAEARKALLTGALSCSRSGLASRATAQQGRGCSCRH